MEAKITKHSQSWFVTGIEGMTQAELDSVLNQVSSQEGFTTDTRLRIATERGIVSCLGSDLDNDTFKQNLILGG